MITLKKHKWFCYLLTMNLLFGSCRVYHKIPLSMEQAAASNQRVKITTIANQKIHFKKIERTDSLYFGFEESGLELIRKPIQMENIKKVQILNKPKSRVLTIAGITIPVALVVLLLSSPNWSTGAGPVGGF